MKDFVTSKNYKAYVNEMRKDGFYGTHVEIQVMSEMFCRPIEIYQPQASGSPIKPLNIFQCASRTSSPPIRLLYLSRNHYDALIDPRHPSVGVGLGVQGLEEAPKSSVEETNVDTVMKESEREQMEKALLQSVMDSSADAQMLKDALKASEDSSSDAQLLQEALKASEDCSADAQVLKEAIKASESELLENEMEQQAKQQSLLEYMLQLSSQIVVPPPQHTKR